MERDELLSLQTYLEYLPDDRVLYDGDERYIYDVQTSKLYEYIQKLSASRSRYMTNVNDISENGYSIEKFEKLCINDCPECCKYENNRCVYDAEACAQYYASGVTNWRELCGYHILFLEGKVPGTPIHPGPWSKETKFIMQPLKRILNASILTLDSQPGLFVEDREFGSYMQKPYIKIGGRLDRLKRILVNLFDKNDDFYDARIIRYVDYGVLESPIEGYINFKEDVDQYGAIFLGIQNPDILTTDLVDYILSNRFFDRIADIIETTP